MKMFVTICVLVVVFNQLLWPIPAWLENRERQREARKIREGVKQQIRGIKHE